MVFRRRPAASPALVRSSLARFRLSCRPRGLRSSVGLRLPFLRPLLVFLRASSVLPARPRSSADVLPELFFNNYLTKRKKYGKIEGKKKKKTVREHCFFNEDSKKSGKVQLAKGAGTPMHILYH